MSWIKNTATLRVSSEQLFEVRLQGQGLLIAGY